MNNTYQVAGYAWALQFAPGATYNDSASYGAFLAQFGQVDADSPEFAAWERGTQDAGVFVRDDEMLSVSQCAALANMNRRYINAEIRAGRLPAQKVGKQNIIHPDDFKKWMNNPLRGSRRDG